MCLLYPLMQHTLRSVIAAPPPGGWERKEELRGSAIPEGSHTVCTSQKPKKQQTCCPVADIQKTEMALVTSKGEGEGETGGCIRYKNIIATTLEGPTLSPSSQDS